MDYKTRFRPLERLGRDGWRKMEDEGERSGASDYSLPFRRERRQLFSDS
jgi:arginine-tRNA-protein transferase